MHPQRAFHAMVFAGWLMHEQRKTPRQRTYLGGRVVFQNRYSTIDCLVRNLSQDGAKLVFSGTTTIPSNFDLMICKNEHSRRAQMVWRTEMEAGVAFVPPSGGSVVSIEDAKTIRTLKLEREALARRVAQLSEPS